MNRSNTTLKVVCAGLPEQETVTGITQYEIIQLAKMIGGLQSFTSKVQAGARKRLFAELNSTVDASNLAFMQACASLRINPKWVEQKYADQFAARSLFADVSAHAVLAGNDKSNKACANLIKGLFGLAVSHGIFGRVALAELQRRSDEYGLASVHEAVVMVGRARDSLTQILLEEARTVIASASAGELWNANIRNKLRDIVHVAMAAETEGVSNEVSITKTKKAADALLHGVGITPLYAA